MKIKEAGNVDPPRGLGAQAVALALSSGVSQLIVAVLYAVTARSTSPDLFGATVAAIALGTACVGFIDFGTNSLWVRELARGNLSSVEFGKRMFTKVTLGVFVGALCIVVILSYAPRNGIWSAIPIAISILISQTAQVPLRSLARGELVAASMLADRVIAGTAFVLLFVNGVGPLDSLWMALCVGALSGAALSWLLTPRPSRPRSPSLTVRLYSATGHYGLSNAALSAQSLDLMIITATGGPLAAGIFGAVSKWTQPLGLLVNAFASASAPYVARAGGLSEAWPHIRKALWLPLTAVVGCLVIVLCSPILVELLLGPEYSGSTQILQLLAIAVIPAIVSQPIAVFLQSMGKDRAVSGVIVLGVGIQLGLLAVLTPLYGVTGAAFGIVVSQLLISLSLAGVLAGVRRSSKLMEESRR